MCNITFDSRRLESHVQGLWKQAYKAAVLGTNLGVENKSEREIWDDAEQLLLNAVEQVIRKYDSDFERNSLATPEMLFERLWWECYEDYGRHTVLMDWEDEAWEIFNRESEKISDYLYDEYNRRSNEFVDVEIEDEEV